MYNTDPPLGSLKQTTYIPSVTIGFEDVEKARPGQEIYFSVKLAGVQFVSGHQYDLKNIRICFDYDEWKPPAVILVEEPKKKPWWKFW